MIVQPLKWDSKFFNLTIGKIDAAEKLNQLSSESIKEYDLIYIEQLNTNKIKKEYSKLFNIQFTDKKTIYLKKLDKKPDKIDSNIQEYSLKTANKKIIDIAIQSGGFSRFKLDNNFEQDQYKKLYEKWIKNSVTKKSADLVLVYGDVKKPMGFITLIYKKQFVQIGLIAVDAELQNNGIGKALINAAEYFALKKRIPKLQVITQSENKNACLFYEKRGFQKDAIIYTHHHWKK